MVYGVVVYFDDIRCAAVSREELDSIVAKVLEVSKMKNVKFNSAKLQYCVESVKFLGFIFDKDR